MIRARNGNNGSGSVSENPAAEQKNESFFDEGKLLFKGVHGDSPTGYIIFYL